MVSACGPMHPLIANFLDLGRASQALAKEAAGEPLSKEEHAFVAAAQRQPQRAARIRAAEAKKQAPVDAQQALILLATDAATDSVLADDTLGEAAHAALAALKHEGATDDEARALLASAVLEEAFGYAETPDYFDSGYLAETLGSLQRLAVVQEDTVDDWLERFSKAKGAGAQAVRFAAAEAVLLQAFDEGPQPITPEHVDDALDALASRVASNDLTAAANALIEFLDFLHQQGVVGPTRKQRLEHLVVAARDAGLNDSDEEEDDEDEALQ
jgi:hypothetical protein